jgi:hypothetical protein
MLDATTRRQRELAEFNHRRLDPALGDPFWRLALQDDAVALRREGEFVEEARAEIAPLVARVPSDPDGFVAWFEALRDIGPGQNDPLFPWLADRADMDSMRWFLTQEVAGEAGFDDLVALAQVKMPTRAKLEMARNYWDEMGRGGPKGMHGPMLARLARHLDLAPTIETTVPEALALGNMMVAFACNRRYAFQAVGALGVIELTAPTRAGYVYRGLRRLGVPESACHYFKLHAVLDVKHSQAWNAEVLHPLVAEDGRRARPLAEGALLRLLCGQRCFQRYRAEFGFPSDQPRSRAA